MNEIRDELAQLRRMRVACLLEGVTLVLLLLVAVPLRHLGGYRVATMIFGPIHGMAFLFYSWTLTQTVAAGAIPGREAARMFFAACIPFGSLFYVRALRRLEAAWLACV